MRLELSTSARILRLLTFILILLCILSFLNRSPYGEPSRAVAYALNQLDSKSITDASITKYVKDSLDPSESDKVPKKIWKKYVLDQIVLPIPNTHHVEPQLLSYQLHGVDRHTLSFRFSGLAPPFVV